MIKREEANFSKNTFEKPTNEQYISNFKALGGSTPTYAMNDTQKAAREAQMLYNLNTPTGIFMQGAAIGYAPFKTSTETEAEKTRK